MQPRNETADTHDRPGDPDGGAPAATGSGADPAYHSAWPADVEPEYAEPEHAEPEHTGPEHTGPEHTGPEHAERGADAVDTGPVYAAPPEVSTGELDDTGRSEVAEPADAAPDWHGAGMTGGGVPAEAGPGSGDQTGTWSGIATGTEAATPATGTEAAAMPVAPTAPAEPVMPAAAMPPAAPSPVAATPDAAGPYRAEPSAAEPSAAAPAVPAAAMPTAVPAAGEGPLVPGEEGQSLRQRWHELQGGFVDDPRESVRQAGDLVGETVQLVSQRLTVHWQSMAKEGEPATEELRQQLRRYRALFERLLDL